MTKKIYIKTYGCQMNEYDSSRLLDALNQIESFIKTDDPQQADLIILNTCSIREKAQEKVFSDLGRFRLIKKANPHLIIAVGGCVASQEGRTLLKRAPYINIIFGPQTLHRLPKMYQTVLNTATPIVDTAFTAIEKFDELPEPKVEGPTAYISIMEGCSRFCTYCIVPYTRGQEISRPLNDVLKEANSLALQGVREITLLGQNVNAYHGQMNNDQFADLAYMIERIATIKGIDRIRFTTSHPNAFSQRLIDAYVCTPKLANHLHLPVQSGSNQILKAMNRRYTVEEFKDKVKRLQTVRPNISISSDFIIGFPGESEEDFQQTLQLIQDISFDHSFSFIYSPRPRTPAMKLKDDVPLETKKRRLAILQKHLNQSALQISKCMVETIQSVLITGLSKKNPHELTGRTENNRVVNFRCDKNLIGQFVNVTIKKVLPNSLQGELTDD